MLIKIFKVNFISVYYRDLSNKKGEGIVYNDYDQ